jgi:hypothetical protein
MGTVFSASWEKPVEKINNIRGNSSFFIKGFFQNIRI